MFIAIALIGFFYLQSWQAVAILGLAACYESVTALLAHKPDPERDELLERIATLERQIKEHQTVVDALKLQGAGRML